MQFLADIWPYIFAALSFALTIVTTIHVILNKEDTGSAVAWAGVIWVAPIIGPVSYVLFGINRINRRAVARRQAMWRFTAVEDSPEEIARELEEVAPQGFAPLVELVDKITRRRVLSGNRFQPLANGDTAYPEMLAAIRSAERSVTLTTYIFNNDSVGREFIDALALAARRGVEVRVMIDAAGTRYSFPARSIMRPLHQAGIRAARFMPTWLPWRMAYTNLRSHRKVLVVDGRLGFTGGMNISEKNRAHANHARAIQDLHFRVEGPVVRHLQEVFVEDWGFTTGETLEGEVWFPPLSAAGPSLARGIDDGPDDTFDRIRQIAFGAITCAQRSIAIVTPYFLPGQALVSALTTAAMRGVRVDIVLPAENNLLFVQWACMAQLEPLLKWDCRVWLTPPPFDHTKLMVVDGGWTLFGSANWDPRSLSLNFEFDVECYDQSFADEMSRLIDAKIAVARRLLLQDVRGRSLPVKLRDGVMRLFSPYL
ncbi:MAG TPA: cardiolipin synthase [Gammaproteobacteria bacterium]|nr:cardiolipin synthase [Gammaproteobacteria bacterium]